MNFAYSPRVEALRQQLRAVEGQRLAGHGRSTGQGYVHQRLFIAAGTGKAQLQALGLAWAARMSEDAADDASERDAPRAQRSRRRARGAPTGR